MGFFAWLGLIGVTMVLVAGATQFYCKKTSRPVPRWVRPTIFIGVVLMIAATVG